MISSLPDVSLIVKNPSNIIIMDEATPILSHMASYPTSADTFQSARGVLIVIRSLPSVSVVDIFNNPSNIIIKDEASPSLVEFSHVPHQQLKDRILNFSHKAANYINNRSSIVNTGEASHSLLNPVLTSPLRSW